MDNKKQRLLLEYLISSTDTFAICQSIVEPEYFDPELRSTVKFIKSYYETYNTTPNTNQIEAETNIALQYHQISRDQISYTTAEIETFCRRKAIERAILASPKLIEEGDYGTVETKIREAVLVSLHRDLGLRYFDDPETRLKRMMNENPVQSTGWREVDALLFGGISRKELLLVSANSGGGKSITLANLGLNFVLSGLNVLYVSLELSEDVIAQRFDTMVTGISRRDWKGHVNEIATRVRAIGTEPGVGVLDIIQLPSGTKASQIESYLKEYNLHYSMMPDLLILDYLDKMSPNEKISASDVWTKDKLTSEQLRDLGVKYNMFIATASQLNRCLDPEGLITMEDYTSKPLKNVQIGDKLLTWDEIGAQHTSNTVLNKKHEVHLTAYEIVLEDGRTIICSGNHQWPTPNGEATIESGLAVGDCIFVNKTL